jgi:hypothetical protein
MNVDTFCGNLLHTGATVKHGTTETGKIVTETERTMFFTLKLFAG